MELRNSRIRDQITKFPNGDGRQEVFLVTKLYLVTSESPATSLPWIVKETVDEVQLRPTSTLPSTTW